MEDVIVWTDPRLSVQMGWGSTSLMGSVSLTRISRTVPSSIRGMGREVPPGSRWEWCGRKCTKSKMSVTYVWTDNTSTVRVPTAFRGGNGFFHFCDTLFPNLAWTTCIVSTTDRDWRTITSATDVYRKTRSRCMVFTFYDDTGRHERIRTDTLWGAALRFSSIRGVSSFTWAREEGPEKIRIDGVNMYFDVPSDEASALTDAQRHIADADDYGLIPLGHNKAFMATSQSPPIAVRCAIDSDGVVRPFDSPPPALPSFFLPLQRVSREPERPSDSMSPVRALERPESCPICLTRPTDVVMEPCGHWICVFCLARIAMAHQACPFCRRSVERFHEGARSEGERRAGDKS